MPDAYINEEKEKAKRRLNVMIHNVSKSPSEDGLTRKSDDIEFGFPLRKERCKLYVTKINLSSDIEKAMVLKHSTKLRSSNVSPVYRVFL